MQLSLSILILCTLCISNIEAKPKKDQAPAAPQKAKPHSPEQNLTPAQLEAVKNFPAATSAMGKSALGSTPEGRRINAQKTAQAAANLKRNAMHAKK